MSNIINLKNLTSQISKIAPRKNLPGGGRKVGTGKFLEPTSVVRIPSSQKPIIQAFLTAKLAINLDAVTEFEIWGVVTGSFRRF